MDLCELPPTRRADLGVSDAIVRRALRSGELVLTRRGILVGRQRIASAVEQRDKHLLSAQIAIAATPGPPTYACLGSAAVVHGFSRLGRDPQRVRLYRRRGSNWRDQEVAVLVC